MSNVLKPGSLTATAFRFWLLAVATLAAGCVYDSRSVDHSREADKTFVTVSTSSFDYLVSPRAITLMPPPYAKTKAVFRTFPLSQTQWEKIRRTFLRIPASDFGWSFSDKGVIDGYAIELWRPDRTAGNAHGIFVANIFVSELDPFFEAMDDALPDDFKFSYGRAMNLVAAGRAPMLTKDRLDDLRADGR